MFIDWYLPGYRAGGPIRSCANIVDHLSDKFDFFIVTRNVDYMENKPYNSIEFDSWVDAPNKNAKVFYISQQNLTLKTIKKLIAETTFDTAYINGIFSLYFSIAPLLFIKHKRVLVATRGMFAKSALNIKATKKSVFLFIIKFLGLYKNIVFHATNQNEKEEIEFNIGKKNTILIAPNLHKLNNDCSEKNLFFKEKGSLKLISLARISPEKNLLFGLSVLKDLEFEGQIQLDIYGAIYDEEYWQQCMLVINSMPSAITISYKGFLHSDEVEKIIPNYHFLFLPTRGENFGHVILESFLAQRPVIISNQTPWVNLKQENVGWEIPLEHNEFKKIILEALSLENNNYQTMVNSCYKYAEEIVNDKKIINQSILLFS